MSDGWRGGLRSGFVVLGLLCVLCWCVHEHVGCGATLVLGWWFEVDLATFCGVFWYLAHPDTHVVCVLVSAGDGVSEGWCKVSPPEDAVEREVLQVRGCVDS